MWLDMYIYMLILILILLIRFHYGSKCFTDLKCPIQFPPTSMGPSDPHFDKSNVVDDSPKTDADAIDKN